MYMTIQSLQPTQLIKLQFPPFLIIVLTNKLVILKILFLQRNITVIVIDTQTKQ